MERTPIGGIDFLCANINPDPMKNRYILIAGALALQIGGAVKAQESTKPANASQMVKQYSLQSPAQFHAMPGIPKGGGPPPNDDCSTVTASALAVPGSVVFTGDNTNATNTNDWAPGSTLDGDSASVWHKFTTGACADISIAYCGTASVFSNVWAFISPSCPASDADYILFASGNFTDCSDGNATIYFTGVPAGTYWYPVMRDSGAPAVGPYTVTVTTTACPAPAANDDCDDATSLTPGTWCNPITGNLGSTESIPAITCNGFTGNANDDVWFSFVATATDMTIAVDGDGGDINVSYDAVVELLEGSCSGPVSIACADGSLGGELEVIEATGLTIGNTYYVRVYHYYPADPDTPTFLICVVEGTGINIGIEEGAAVGFAVFPNPGNGDFTIQMGEDAGMTTIELIDLRGRVVFTEVVNLASGQQHELPLNGRLAQGSYTLRLTAAHGTSEQAVMVR